MTTLRCVGTAWLCGLLGAGVIRGILRIEKKTQKFLHKLKREEKSRQRRKRYTERWRTHWSYWSQHFCSSSSFLCFFCSVAETQIKKRRKARFLNSVFFLCFFTFPFPASNSCLSSNICARFRSFNLPLLSFFLYFFYFHPN